MVASLTKREAQGHLATILWRMIVSDGREYLEEEGGHIHHNKQTLPGESGLNG